MPKHNAAGTALVRFRQLTPEMSNYNDYMDVVDILSQASTYNGLLNGQDASKMKVLADGTTTSNTLSSRFAQQYNVMDYGATGNGTTDDTTAIQAAINAADTASTGIVFFPPGVYKFSTISVSSFITLQGSGWWFNANATWTLGSSAFTGTTNLGGTILRSTATSGSAVSFVTSIVGQIGLRDLGIIGPGSGTSTGLQIGFATDSSHKNPIVASIVSNVFVGNFSSGVALEWVEDCIFTGLRIRGCTNGLALTLNANNNSFTNLDISACVNGLSTDDTCITNSFYAPVLQYNTGNVALIAGQLNVINNPYLENPSCNYAVTFDGTTVNANALHDAYLSTAADNVVISSNARYTVVDGYLSHAGATVTDSGVLSSISTRGFNTSPVSVSQSTSFQVQGGTNYGAAIGAAIPGGTLTNDLVVSGTSPTVSWTKLWSSTAVDSATGAHMLIPISAVGRVGLSVRQFSNSQTANTIQVTTSSGVTVLFSVSSDGKIIQTGSNHMSFAAAIPTTGTWAQGDVVFNTGVAAGGSPGWSCTVAGTPGTWKAMANVSA